MAQAVELTKTSDSTILISIVVIAMVLLAMIPVIRTIDTIRKNRSKVVNDREGLLIGVIERNTEVNSALKTLIENDQKHCTDCRKEQKGMFQQLQDNQDIANMKLVEIHTILKK